MKLKHAKANNDFVIIEPFATHHIAPLLAAGADGDIFRFMPGDIDGTSEKMLPFLEAIMKSQNCGQWLAHVIFSPEKECAGMSCYMALRPENKGLEIGCTWYAPKFQGTKINPAAKLALLENAFSSGAKRVELKTDDQNKHSQAAILKMGAKFEGIFRRHMLRADGTWRDSYYYSVIDEDWPEVKAGLIKRLRD